MYEVQFHCMFGPCSTELPEPMELDDWDEAREVFTSGQCHAFAIAGAELLPGAKVVARGECDELNVPCWNHLGVLLPGDQVLDVEGLHDLDDWLDSFDTADEDDWAIVQPEQILAVSSGDPNTGAYWPPNLEAGRAYAEHVARQYDHLAGLLG